MGESKSMDVEIEAFVERGAERFLERFVTVEWVALSSDAEPDTQPRHRAPTRQQLIEQLVTDNEGDREYVEAKLIHGDLFLRERLTVSVWANDEDESPTLSWVTDSDDDVAAERDEARAELATMRADLAALTARMEVEIPAACAVVRARAIAECVALVAKRARWAAVGAEASAAREEDAVIAEKLRALAAEKPATPEPAEAARARAIAECVAAALTHTIAPGLALSEPNADPTQIALARVVHRAVTAVVDTLRALAAPQPTAVVVESLDVDPEASAYR